MPLQRMIESLAPTTGPLAGGTACVLTGTGFTDVVRIAVGGVATAVVVVDDTRITFTTPAGTEGAQTVVLTDDAGGPTAAGHFTYE